MSSGSINCGPLNIKEKCSNFIQEAPANPADSSHFMYHTQK